MRDEIGSFYESTEYTKGKNQKETLEEWIIKSVGTVAVQWVSSGRDAIMAAVLDIEKKERAGEKICILPQYTCDSVVRPFKKNGWKIFYYPVDKEFRVDRQEIKEMLLKIKPTVLLMNTYYGVDTLCNVRDIIRECQEHINMIFIEDMIQSLALLKQGSMADYCVGSLRKWFAVPDGGFIASRERLDVVIEGEKEEFIARKRRAQLLKLQYLQGCGQIEKREILELNKKAEECLDADSRICAMSNFSKTQLRQMDYSEMFLTRNENAKYLLKSIEALEKVTATLLVKEESPLYVPVFVEEREKLQYFLKERNIFAPVLWPIPDGLENVMNLEVQSIYEHLLALPCDQRYSLRDMERISKCLLDYERNNGEINGFY